MKFVQRFGTRGIASGVVAVAALLAGGCSTDFRRLEQPSLALNDNPGPRPTQGMTGRPFGAGAPIDRGEGGWPDSGPRAPLPPPAPITAQPLPPARPDIGGPASAGSSKPFDRPKTVAGAATPTGLARPPVTTTGSIEVQPGDTLYALAKRHRVSINELMEANGLKSPNLKPGQKLALPAASGPRKALPKGTQVASAGAAIPATAVVTAPVKPAPVVAPAAPSGPWTGSYTVKAGETLSVIARAHRVPVAELQSQNAITEPTKVRPGTVLKVPGPGGAAGVQSVPAVADGGNGRVQPITPIAAPAAAPTGLPSPRVINAAPEPAAAPAGPAGEPTVAPIVPTAAAPAVAATTTAAAKGKFRWPVKGSVLQPFGKRPDGSQNDGIAIAVPVGTEVHAAGDGTVAYAGSELKGYGNLILVRHDNGFVSAYAHASELLVKRGDAIKRGQVIAKSGQTGAIDQPMLHFELREGTKPVDPLPHLDKL
jgi:murein DD-endopeptidase MepM/ murein hydrolase activator NlpD